jgi:hypothetical protein
MLVDNFRLFYQLQQEQQRLRILFDVVPLGFVLVDTHGNVLLTNQQAEQFIPQLAVVTDSSARICQYDVLWDGWIHPAYRRITVSSGIDAGYRRHP